MLFQHLSRFAVLFAALNCFAFVPALLTFSKGDDQLDVSPVGQKFRRDNCHALFAAQLEGVNLFAAGEQFAGTGVDASRIFPTFVELEAEAGVVEPELTVFD